MARKPVLASALLALCLGVAPVGAKGPIAIAPDAVFTHAPAGVSIPAMLDGLPRGTAMDMGNASMVDVGLDYRAPTGSEITSVYIFRLAIGSPELWFDRARVAVVANRQLGTLVPAPTELFAAPGARVPNAMRGIHAIEGGTLRSTAVAMVPVDGWMIVLRMSSATLDRDGLRARLDRTIAAIDWPAFARARPSYAMARCAAPLHVDAPARPLAGNSVAAGLIGAMVASSSARAPDGSAAQPAPARWCRDAFVGAQQGIYRQNEATDTYIIALGDGGNGIIVAPSPIDLPPGTQGKSWSASLVQLDSQIFFPFYDGIPQPQQALDQLQKAKPISVATTWPRQGAITLSMPPK